jgi:REP element-mobilizing transposase RayT
MSYLRIWLHCVWTTNRRIPFLRDELKSEVILHIRNNAKIKGIYIDHIKGESSFWINKNKLTRLKFEWQDDFYSVSIGMSQLNNLRLYIRNQDQHHQKVSFQEELDLLIEEYKLQKMRD